MSTKRIFLPISKLYGAVTSIRNFFFRVKILKKYQPPVFTLSVGNLQVGGTGKTPHVEYIINLFENIEIAVLSRGYGRKTTGFVKADANSTSKDIGDEPLQVFNKFGSKIGVYVSENRPKGVLEILKIRPPSVLVLDDAFQHQYITANLNLLLTTFSDPFTEDEMLPVGRLREAKENANRADAIIVTKCPEQVSNSCKKLLISNIREFIEAEKPIFFSSFSYGLPVCYGTKLFSKQQALVLISGIAKPKPFEEYCKSSYHVVNSFRFKDHHDFTLESLQKIILNSGKVQYLTTEKDYVKIRSIISADSLELFFYLPIEVCFEKENEFKNYILTTFATYESS